MKIKVTLVLLVILAGGFVASCNIGGSKAIFFRCQDVVRTAHLADYKGIEDIKSISSKDVGQNSGSSREWFVECLKDDGGTYPRESEWNSSGTLLVTWQDKAGEIHISLVQESKEIAHSLLQIEVEKLESTPMP